MTKHKISRCVCVCLRSAADDCRPRPRSSHSAPRRHAPQQALGVSAAGGRHRTRDAGNGNSRSVDGRQRVGERADAVAEPPAERGAGAGEQQQPGGRATVEHHDQGLGGRQQQRQRGRDQGQCGADQT